MADITDKPPSANVFDQFDDAQPGAEKPAKANVFDQFDGGNFQPIVAPQGSAGGAFTRSFARGVAPAAGGLIGAGAGAEAGAAVGLLGGPFAEITVPVGAAIGGVLGFFGGSYATESAQHYALKQAPDSWTDALGMSDRQQRLDEAQHPIASFLGGLTPYALTMRPGGFARSALPENATVMQRIMANPVTKPLFGGATMGGLELGQEATNGDVDWRKVAIATGFGIVWNKPARLGEAITELGARPARAGLEAAARPFSMRGLSGIGERDAPYTIAMAGDARVIGPGITEEVFRGTERQDPQAQMVAQQMVRTEQRVTGRSDVVGPDVHEVARRIDPDTFTSYDALSQQRDQFRQWLEEYQNPSQESLQQLQAERDALQGGGGFIPRKGPEARRFRAQLRDLDRQYQEALERRQAYMEGRLEETPEAAQVRQRLMAVDEQMRDMAPQVSAAYRRADEALRSGTVPEAPRPAQPVPVPVPAQPQTAPTGAPAALGPVTTDIAQGKAAIVADAFRQLVAAGWPADEARAAATLIAARYAARAARMKGALGTAEDLYRKEGARIQGVGGPRGAPPAPSAAQPVGRTGESRETSGAVLEMPRPAGSAGAAVLPRVPQEVSAGVAPAGAGREAATSVQGLPPENRGPKGYEDWTPGKEVSLGPLKQLTVVEARPDGFILRSRQGQVWDFTPPDPKKAPKEENSVEWLAYAKEVRQPRPDVEAAPETPATSESVVPEAQAPTPAAPAAPPRPLEVELAQHQTAQGEAFQNGLPTARPPRGWRPDAELATMAQRLARGKPAMSEGRRPFSLSEFVRRNGGIKRGTGEADDLIAQDRGDLVRTNGRGFDDVAESARDAGFDIGPDTGIGNGVDHDRFMEMLHEDASGRQKHYPESRETDEFLARQRFNEVYREALEKMGLRLKGMPPREIAWILSHDEPTQRALYLTERGDRLGDDASLEMVYLLDRENALAMEEGRPDPGAWEMADHREMPQPTREELERFYDDYERASGIARPGGQAAREQGVGTARPDETGARPAAAGEPTSPAEAVSRPGRAQAGLEPTKESFAEQVARLRAERKPAENLVDEALKQDPIRLVLRRGDQALMLSRDLDDATAYRITSFDKEGPVGHRVYSGSGQGIFGRDGMVSEVNAALREGYAVEQRGGPLKTEQTEQGTQTLVPGVEPVSARERAEAAMQKPLQGGSRPPPAGGLFDEDARNQKDLFSAKGKIRVTPGQRSIITLMRDADASTVVHELGHDFFEQLMRDAEHPQAPPEVRDDAQSLYDALKVNGREEVKTRHHEQIARWFEQYMREGRAPSQGLADVFAQFKNWLLNIYQTIKGLGRPISDDVRKVFDRMLAEEPQRTVITPDRTAAPTLADIQRADARETEPAQAEPVMDRIVAETQQAEARIPPEVQNEIQAVLPEAEAAVEARGEAGPGAEPAGGVGGGGEQPGAEPAGGGMGETNEPVVGGGSAAGAKGPSAPAGGAAERSGANAGPPLSPAPADLFGPRESPFVDKAGNIRLENLTTMEDVRQAIREAAQANDDFIGDRGGVVTDQQVDDLASAAGMQGAERLVAARVRGQAFNAVEIMTLRKALIESAGEVNAAMRRVDMPSSTDQDVLWYAMVRDRHQMLQATVAQATAEAGRALRAFRDISEAQAGGVDEYIRQATGRTLYQMREEAKLGAKLDTPEKVSKFLQDAKKPGFGRMILEYWINNLISGPATHTTYAIGNTLLAVQKMGPETAVAALLGNIQRARGRAGETVRMGEVGAQFKGIAQGFLPAVNASLESLRTGTTALLPGETRRMAMPFQPGVTGAAATPVLNEAARAADVMANAFGVIRGMRDAFVAMDPLLKTGEASALPFVGTEYSPLGAIPDIRVGGAVLPVGTIQRLPSRMVAAIHTFFRVLIFSAEKSALAYRTASNEGLAGTAFDARTGELWQNPTPAIMEASRSQATELALMGQGSKFAQALSRLTNTEVFGFPILKFIDPFVHISSNVIDQSIIKRTPIGLLSPELRADLSGRNGNIAQDRAQARMLVGTAFAMTVGGLAAQGLASGSGPSDPREAAMWRLAGNQAHSVRIGDIWYDTHRLGPLGMLMGIGADMYDVAHLATEGEFTKAAAHLQHAITQNILDESFMRGPSDLIRAIEDPGRYGEAYVRNFLSSFLPFSVGMAQEARAADPYSREARTVVDAMRQKIPFASMDLLPRVDIWGQPIPNRDALISPGITALYMQHISTDPVNLAMVELGIHPAPVERKIRNVELTDEQHLKFAQYAGRMSKARLDVIVRSPDWQVWDPQTKRDIVQAVIRQSREVARAQIMAADPTIIQRATAAKLDKLRR